MAKEYIEKEEVMKALETTKNCAVFTSNEITISCAKSLINKIPTISICEPRTDNDAKKKNDKETCKRVKQKDSDDIENTIAGLITTALILGMAKSCDDAVKMREECRSEYFKNFFGL